jgi:hypothetical protein
MKRDSWASLLACTLASPCPGREPKVKVAIVFVATVAICPLAFKAI